MLIGEAVFIICSNSGECFVFEIGSFSLESLVFVVLNGLIFFISVNGSLFLLSSVDLCKVGSPGMFM